MEKWQRTFWPVTNWDSQWLSLTKNKSAWRSAVVDASFTVKVSKVSMFGSCFTVAENYHVILQRSPLD